MMSYIFPKYMGNVRGAGVGNNRKNYFCVPSPVDTPMALPRGCSLILANDMVK